MADPLLTDDPDSEHDEPREVKELGHVLAEEILSERQQQDLPGRYNAKVLRVRLQRRLLSHLTAHIITIMENATFTQFSQAHDPVNQRVLVGTAACKDCHVDVTHVYASLLNLLRDVKLLCPIGHCILWAVVVLDPPLRYISLKRDLSGELSSWQDLLRFPAEDTPFATHTTILDYPTDDTEEADEISMSHLVLIDIAKTAVVLGQMSYNSSVHRKAAHAVYHLVKVLLLKLQRGTLHTDMIVPLI
ncbi:hypothetical protein LTR91_017995 [Friedmanniomyces endolithicus]|uniref:Uncharacterized protein n=1 Tax=Friedmanniomyces endolithicus TaxID=329885 RepID=A0AAN6HFF2_9PEZI|nr:hypothetical protein LTR94_008646 [Friedmanniomyces endolithicus]KAK0791205.1 hypothetical protein LTR59_008929 [Friedmanniomyces endolithicus]KAK0797466.1 hypothetical protein LTR38_008168 [Friedmanniomyces endolithicus]KAK0816320.1 hypothetical protein LTR75_003545 [Friedmanniomyces endolithicus]KAK0839286.1 hypothetical protein LTR03_011360 [Friedmanniomyces endolithicus]